MKRAHKIILDLLKKKGAMNTYQIKKELGCSWSTVYMALLEMEMMGMVRKREETRGFGKKWVWEVVE